MKKINVKIKLLSIIVQIPKYQSVGSAGFDLHSTIDYELYPSQSVLIGSGLAMAIPLGYELQIRPRSGLAYKHQITVLNTPGTIDSDYRGEVKVLLMNHGNESFHIKRGDRIAQGVLKEVITAMFEEVTNLENTNRGTGGFGSTGK